MDTEWEATRGMIIVNVELGLANVRCRTRESQCFKAARGAMI